MIYDPELHAGYISPLTEKDHARLGRIVILWGQTESMIDLILPAFCDLTQDEIAVLGIYDKPMAAKTMFLKTVSKSRAHKAVHDMVLKFVTIIENTKVERNHAFHSMWGWRVDDRKKSVEPCARYLKNPEKALTPSHLVRLEKELNKCARIGKNLLHLSMGEGPDYNPARYFHGALEAPPQWFVQWLERNPVCLENLDCGPKGGQLPRLREPHSHK